VYKLTVVSGPNRGSTYPVQDGEIAIGRQAGNTILLSSSKVSKRHCVISVNGSDIVVQDQGSSNGTFVNGILVKVKKVKPGDRISVGEFVLELTEPVRRSPSTAPAAAGFGNIISVGKQAGPAQSSLSSVAGIGTDASGIPSSSEPPKDLKGKIIWFFENRLMPIFYGLNLKYEWNLICIVMFAVFVIGNLIVSVYPILESSRITILRETGVRARFMAKQIAEQNAPYLAARNETRSEIGIAENAEGVRIALLLDLDNRIIAPSAKLNQYLAAGSEAGIALRARDRFRAGNETGFWVPADPDLIVAVEPVKILNPAAGKNIVVAMALVSIDTSLSTPDIGEMGTIYSETLILTGILGGLILLVLYRMTLKPFQVLNEDLDPALKGDISQVTHEFKLQELNPLWDIINSAIQRIPKANGSSGGMGNMGGMDNSQYVEEFVGPLRTLGNIVKIGLVVFDSEKKIVYLNSMFEEMSGVRSDSGIGKDMSEVARDQAMAAFTNDILGRSPVGGEGVSEDFDFSGITYKMYAAAFGSAGGVAKCYFLAAMRAEG
jgi:PAS domain-containing protein